MLTQIVLHEGELEIRTKKLVIPITTYVRGPKRYDLNLGHLVIEEVEGGVVKEGPLWYNPFHGTLSGEALTNFKGDYSPHSKNISLLSYYLGEDGVLAQICMAVDDFMGGKQPEEKVKFNEDPLYPNPSNSNILNPCLRYILEMEFSR